MTLKSKRRLSSSSPPPTDVASAKSRYNIFAMQQANNHKARRLPSTNTTRTTINPTEEVDNTLSMRFSFTLPENSTFKRDRFRRAMLVKHSTLPKDSPPPVHASDPMLNRSFGNLSFSKETASNGSFVGSDTDDAETVVDSGGSFEIVEVHRSFSMEKSGPPVIYPSLPTPHQAVSDKQSMTPILSLPKKRRTGFGLSYTDSHLYDTDEYPDTEGETDSDSDSAPKPSLKVPVLPVNNTFSFVSFDDAIVLRDIGSFHIARPQRLLPCTSASREDTIRVKAAAQSLLKFDESMEIYGILVLRLERMVKAAQMQGRSISVADCARKLRDFLLRTADERVTTGEVEEVVRHEGEWAGWMVEAARTGVMHVKSGGCRCRADWEG